MKINFIVTAYDKEDFWEPLKSILKRYQKIKASWCLAYNGDRDDCPRDIWIQNRGHQQGDMDLTIAGYRMLNSNGVHRFIKIGVDSWLLNEDKIIGIFEAMEKNRCGYGGNRWHEGETSLATDVIFADLRFGNVFDGLKMGPQPAYEWAMYEHCRKHKIRVYVIPERTPVHDDEKRIKDPNRMECAALHWTMHHQIEKNIANVKQWGYS